MRTDLSIEECWPLFACAGHPSTVAAGQPKPRKAVKARHAIATAWAARKRLMAKASRKAENDLKDTLLPE